MKSTTQPRQRIVKRLSTTTMTVRKGRVGDGSVKRFYFRGTDSDEVITAVAQFRTSRPRSRIQRIRNLNDGRTSVVVQCNASKLDK
jgi:hypothetical protein